LIARHANGIAGVMEIRRARGHRAAHAGYRL